MESIILLALMVVLILLGGPIGFVLISLPIGYILVTGDAPLNIIPFHMYERVASVPLIAAPFFILTGELMATSTITDRLVELSQRAIGRLRGGLAHVNILVSMFFAGINGSVVADTATVGSIMIPAMRRAGYSAEFSAAITAVSATMGGIIPPSIAMIILANAGGLSVGGLFAGGIIPGVMIGLILMVITWVIAVKRGYEKSDEAFSWRQLGGAALRASFALIIPLVLVGSVVGGIASPVEAGAITAATALLIGIFLYRVVTWESCLGAFVRTFKTSASVFVIIAASGPFTWLLTILGAIKWLEEWLTGFADQPIIFALVLVAIILIIGMIMDAVANIIVVGPVLIEICVNSGIPGIQAGLIVIVGFLIGTVTPPIGIAYFAAAAIARARLESVAVAMIPYLVALGAILFLVVVVPDLTLWLPRLWGFID